MFTAVAEATEDSSADGECVALVSAIIDADDRLRALWQTRTRPEVEGIVARVSSKGLELTVVTDAEPCAVCQRSYNGSRCASALGGWLLLWLVTHALYGAIEFE